MKLPLLYIFIVSALVTPTVCHAAHSDNNPAHTSVGRNEVKKVLQQLDREIKLRDTYKNMRQMRRDSIRIQRNNVRTDSRRWFDLTMDIAGGYSSFDNDSALVFYTQWLVHASAIGNDSLATEFRLRRATYLSIAGYVHDALNELELVDTTAMTSGQKRTYFDATRRMYSFISNYYEGFLSTADYWNNRAIEAQGKLIPLLPKGSVEYMLNLGEYLYGTRQYARSREVMTTLINKLTLDTPGYAIACHKLASLANTAGDQNERIYYLALSAIADTRQGNMEVTSIQELGGLLFQNGDSERAHNYLLAAMNNVVESRASVRLSQTTQLLTVIENDHMLQIARYRRLVLFIFIILVACMLALVAAIWILRRQLRRLDGLKRHLEESNRAKEVYMSRFLTLCSIYMDKLKQLGKIVDRKISAGQTEELARLVKSNKFMEEQSREFYSVFDDAFLHIYPRFIEQVNDLLKPDSRITPAEGELLTPGLRILALMRLGIDDAPRLAQMLNFSVNTIYAYRNKLRNRALNRQTFETDISTSPPPEPYPSAKCLPQPTGSALRTISLSLRGGRFSHPRGRRRC